MATTEGTVGLPANAKAQMSPLMLRVLLNARSLSPDPPLISSTADAILQDMLILQKNFNFACMEKFHALFEVLRAELLTVIQKQHTSTLGDLYPGARISASDASRAMLQEVVPLRMRHLDEDPQQVTVHLSKDWCTERVDRIVLPAPGNPGFDIAIPLDGDRLLVIDTKFSKPPSGKKAYLNKADDIDYPRKQLDACLSKITGTPLNLHVTCLRGRCRILLFFRVFVRIY